MRKHSPVLKRTTVWGEDKTLPSGNRNSRGEDTHPVFKELQLKGRHSSAFRDPKPEGMHKSA